MITLCIKNTSVVSDTLEFYQGTFIEHLGKSSTVLLKNLSITLASVFGG